VVDRDSDGGRSGGPASSVVYSQNPTLCIS